MIWQHIGRLLPTWEGVFANDLTVCGIRSRHSLIHQKFADRMMYIFRTLTIEYGGLSNRHSFL